MEERADLEQALLGRAAPPAEVAGPLDPVNHTLFLDLRCGCPRKGVTLDKAAPCSWAVSLSMKGVLGAVPMVTTIPESRLCG